MLCFRQLGRRVSPTLYSVAEFRRRRADNNPFLTKVLADETVRLTDDRNLRDASLLDERADAVRAKLAELDLSEQDISEAIAAIRKPAG